MDTMVQNANGTVPNIVKDIPVIRQTDVVTVSVNPLTYQLKHSCRNVPQTVEETKNINMHSNREFNMFVSE